MGSLRSHQVRSKAFIPPPFLVARFIADQIPFINGADADVYFATLCFLLPGYRAAAFAAEKAIKAGRGIVDLQRGFRIPC